MDFDCSAKTEGDELQLEAITSPNPRAAVARHRSGSGNRAPAVYDDGLPCDVVGSVGRQEHADPLQLTFCTDRGIGDEALMAGSTRGSTGSASREWKNPGAIALTRMSCRPHEAASSRVSPMSPALDAA